MDTALLAAQVLLAAVFAAAAVGKLLDLPGSRKALADFGLSDKAASVGGLLLPLTELAIAIALIPEQSARWGALGALLLLLAFLAGIANALRRGETPDCHCFGQIHSSPAGRETLVRNGALALLATVLVWRGAGAPIDEWFAARAAAELAALAFGIAAAVLGATTLRLRRENRTLADDLTIAKLDIAALPPGLPVGLPAPAFALPDVDGRNRTLQSLCDRGRDVVLVFATPDCAGCRQLLPDIGRWQASLSDRLTIAVVSTGSAAVNKAAFAEHDIGDVVLQTDTEVMSDYRLRATPSAVLVGPDGKIASALAAGAVTIESLIRLSLRRDGASGLGLGGATLQQAELSETS